jgi:hypothetical protein
VVCSLPFDAAQHGLLTFKTIDTLTNLHIVQGGTAFAFRIGEHEEVPKPPEKYPHSCGIYEED